MVVVTGETKCVLCGNPLWATDDIFALRHLSSGYGAGLFKEGACHYRCFIAAPFRREYLLQRREAERQIALNAVESAEHVRSGDFFVKALPGGRFRLMLVPAARHLQFRGAATLSDLRNVLCVSGGRGGIGISVEETATGAIVQLTNPTPVQIDIAAKDVPALLRIFDRNDIQVGKVIDLSAPLVEAQVIPVSAGAPLSSLRGRLARSGVSSKTGTLNIVLNVDSAKEALLEREDIPLLCQALERAISKWPSV